MAYSVGAVHLDLKTNIAPFQKQMQGLSQTANTSVSRAFSGLGAIIGGAFAGTALVAFGKQAIALASQLEEVQNVVDVTFGAMNQKVNEWSKTMLASTGIGEASAKRYASTLGAMLKSMGNGPDKVYEMSTGMAQLAGDMASFYNLSTDDAFDKIRAGISGETEPLKRLGVNMSIANMEAFALSKGITKSYQSMNQMEQSQLRYAYLMSVTKDAQGDFMRTSDSWANQIRLLTENWKIFASTLGKAFIQVLTPILQGLNILLASLQKVATAFASFMSLFSKKKSEETKKTAESIYGTGDAMTTVGEASKKASKDMKGSLLAFDELNNMSSSASDSLNDASSSLADADFGTALTSESNPEVDLGGTESGLNRLKTMLEATTIYIQQVFGPTFQTAMTVGTDMLKGMYESWSMIFSDLVNVVVLPAFSTLTTVILPLWSYAIENMILISKLLFDAIKGLFDTTWNDVIVPAMGFLVKIWQDSWQIVSDLWMTYGDPIFKLISEAITITYNHLQYAWNTYGKPVWDEFMKVVTELWDNHMKPFIANFGGLVAELIILALNIYNKVIMPLIRWFADLLGPTFSNFFKSAINWLGGFFSVAFDTIGAFISIFNGLIKFLNGDFSGAWKDVWSGLSVIFKGIVNGLVDIMKAPINAIIALINGAINSMNGIKVDIPKWVPVFGGSTFGLNLPKIPYLANGGIVTSPTLAMVGENNRKEAVIPLQNSSFLNDFAELIASMIGGGGQTSNQPIQINVVLEDGVVLGRALIKTINKATLLTGEAIDS